MRAPGVDLTELVVAARSGDRKALDELVVRFLPLVYTVVGRALRGDPDVDDVVQDTMLRAVRDLPTLREPASFRAWLMAIAVRQVGTHLHRRGIAERRTAPLADAADLPDQDADVDDRTMLHLALAAQRRQVARASRWLDPADRMLVSLLWLEHVGQLTRAELTEAAGLTAAHAGVRVQRARQQLEVSRAVVAALDAQPGCPALRAASSGWDGVPGPLWRKRLSRHVRSCPACRAASAGLVPTDRLLVAALLPVPPAVTAATLAKVKAPAGVLTPPGGALLGRIAGAVGTRPAMTLVAAGVLAAGAAVLVPQGPEPTPPAAIAATPPGPSPSAVALPRGPLSLEAVDEPGRYATTDAGLGVLVRVEDASTLDLKRSATFEVTPGLADAGCFALRSQDGRYLRHMSWRLRLSRPDGSALFRGDATFCARPGAEPGSVALESANYPGWYVRHRGGELWVDQGPVGTDASFRIRSARAG